MDENEYRIFHIIKGNSVEIKSAIFADGDTYVVEDPQKKILYIWIGNKSTVDEKFAAAEISQTKLIELHRQYKIKTIEQGKEPKEFLNLFGENIKFVKGDVHSLLKTHEKKK
jgi:Gelsolin repeat